MSTIPVGETPRRVVVNPYTNLVYVSNQISNSLSVIDGVTNEVVDSIPVEQPYELMRNPNTNKIYSTYFGYSSLSIVSEEIIEQDSPVNEILILVAGLAIAGAIVFFNICPKGTHRKLAADHGRGTYLKCSRQANH